MARGVPRSKNPAPTPQQKRAIDLFKRQLLSGGTKSLVEILREAGYSENSANQQVNVMAGIRPHLQSFIERMERHREKVMERMEKEVRWADYGELIRSLDVLTHNIRLLGGQSTENFAIAVSRREELDRLIDN